MKLRLLTVMSVYSTLWCADLVAQSVDTGPFAASSADELDILMMVVSESDTPNSIINRIQLPPVQVEKITVDQTDLIEIDARSAQGETDYLANAIERVISDNISDQIVSGDITNIAADVLDALPAEDIEAILNGETEDLEEVSSMNINGLESPQYYGNSALDLLSGDRLNPNNDSSSALDELNGSL